MSRETEACSSSAETHRFYLAVLMIASMVALIFIPTIYRDYASAQEMAAIFSGWIAAIVGFYYLQHNTEKTREELDRVSNKSERAKEEAIEATRRTNSLINTLETTISKYRKLVKTSLEKVDEDLSYLEKKLEEP